MSSSWASSVPDGGHHGFPLPESTDQAGGFRLFPEALLSSTSICHHHTTVAQIYKTYAEAEAPILWPPDQKSQLIVKDPDAGKH